MKISKKWKKITPGDIILHKCTKNHDHRLYSSWDMACNACIVIFHFGLPFYPPTSLENENIKKMKKDPGDIIIWHNFTKNHDHMLYSSWDMVCDTHNRNSPKNQNFKKMKKKYIEISSFYTCAPKTMITRCRGGCHT